MAKFDDIIGELKEKKAKYLDSVNKDAKEKKRRHERVVQRVDLKEELKKELSAPLIKTGTLLDDLVGSSNDNDNKDKNGFMAGTSMLIYGEYGTGKTETILTMALLCPYDSILIDSENSTYAVRLKEMCDARGLDWEEASKKIHLYQPQNWVEQMYLLDELPSPIDAHTGKIGFISVDSLTKLFRGIEFAGRESLTTKQPLIREYIAVLDNIAKIYGAVLIVTTQVYEDPDSSKGAFMPDWTNQKAVGGSSALHQTTFVLFLHKGNGIVRIARLMDADYKPLRQRPFILTASGIENVPDTEKSEKLIEKSVKGFDEKQLRVLDDPKNKTISEEPNG